MILKSYTSFIQQQQSLLQTMEPCKLWIIIGNWFLTWHIVLSEDCTLVLKHIGGSSLIFICICLVQCV